MAAPQLSPEPFEIEFHGWDSREQAWHGPTPLDFRLAGCRGILSRLRLFPGSWHGRVQARLAGGWTLSFCASAHDLEDSGLALLDLPGSFGGPLQAMLVVPAQRRKRVRPELAFEFVSYIRFLQGPQSDGMELKLHDYIERTLQEADPALSLIFAVENRRLEPETQLALCDQAEKIAAGMLVWMNERDGLPASA